MDILSDVLIRVTNLFANSLVILLITRIVLSWIYPNMRNTLIFWIWRLTEPILQPLRRLLPMGGRFDWSPVVALIAIHFVRAFLVRFFYTMS